jgi:hypothetical protein
MLILFNLLMGFVLSVCGMEYLGSGMNGIFAILLMVIVGSGNPLRPYPIANNNLHLKRIFCRLSEK